MTYAETVDYLFTRLPMFSRQGAGAIRKDLTNTLVLCEALANPQARFRSVHVAGTNGKGSVSHMLAAILQAAGYKTGLYTSPHLYDFRERIRINGMMIPEENVVAFTDQIQPLIDSIEPSFFEITVAMAFDYFAREKVDIAIIEVGLGGRLDSTNIIRSELSVITNIGWDHMNLLGDSLPAIAAEKGGIIKTGVRVVIGEHGPDTDDVFYKLAEQRGAPIVFAADHFTVRNHQQSGHLLQLEIEETATGALKEYKLDLTGTYQLKNACTVLQAVRLLQQSGWTIPESAIAAGFSTARQTGLRGRWDVIANRPLTVLDVAHNPSGIVEMMAQVNEISCRHLHLVLGMVRDKDLDGILSLLPRSARYYFAEAHIPRALAATDLQAAAARFGLAGNRYEDVNEALLAARNAAHGDDLIIVCGSIFLVAEVRRENSVSTDQ
ncbi:MAG: bifunctional folylpolyglutamate synthase/dihydrofolate synthase [Flaviaesturariibacter sp.]|nr:bifunctional folylpolyglutamate synthase/dihydrofolate synthase [Flaviaesturariibacter sp.]